MLIEAVNIEKGYSAASGRQSVLERVSLSLAAGETLALTGESGSGKSTLLHILAALDIPDSGIVILCGKEISSLGDLGRAQIRRNSVGLVFQQYNLIPSLTVTQNLAFQARMAGRQDSVWTEQLCDRLGLAALRDRYPEQLSGGQQQRVAIGRALAPRPPVILADEPTGNLDEATSDDVLSLMLELVAETGAGLLMVTHSTRLASRLSRQVHLSQGKLT